LRILLINPPYPSKSIGFKKIITVEPLVLEYLGATVPQHDVRIFDMVIEDDIVKEL